MLLLGCDLKECNCFCVGKKGLAVGLNLLVVFALVSGPREVCFIVYTKRLSISIVPTSRPEVLCCLARQQIMYLRGKRHYKSHLIVCKVETLEWPIKKSPFFRSFPEGVRPPFAPEDGTTLDA